MAFPESDRDVGNIIPSGETVEVTMPDGTVVEVVIPVRPVMKEYSGRGDGVMIDGNTGEVIEPRLER